MCSVGLWLNQPVFSCVPLLVCNADLAVRCSGLTSFLPGSFYMWHLYLCCSYSIASYWHTESATPLLHRFEIPLVQSWVTPLATLWWNFVTNAWVDVENRPFFSPDLMTFCLITCASISPVFWAVVGRHRDLSFHAKSPLKACYSGSDLEVKDCYSFLHFLKSKFDSN